MPSRMILELSLPHLSRKPRQRKGHKRARFDHRGAGSKLLIQGYPIR